MSKYAITVCAGIPYIAGLNCLLNALEYYGMNVDVHIGSTKFVLKEYYEYIKNKFSFHIEIHYLEELCGIEDENNFKGGDIDYYYIWSKYGIGLRIKDDYDAILHLDARCCPVDDITKYFTIAEKTGFLLCTENPRARFTNKEIYDFIERGAVDDFCRGVSILNFLFFYNPKEYSEFLEYMWKERDSYREVCKVADPHSIIPVAINVDDMALFSKGICEFNKIEQVLLLPNVSWISDYCLYKNPLALTSTKSLVFDVGEKIKVFRGRYYYREEYNIYDLSILTSKEKEESMVFKNVKLITDLVRFLNYECTVTLDEVKKIHGKYYNFLHLIDHYNNTI